MYWRSAILGKSSLFKSSLRASGESSSPYSEEYFHELPDKNRSNSNDTRSLFYPNFSRQVSIKGLKVLTVKKENSWETSIYPSPVSLAPVDSKDSSTIFEVESTETINGLDYKEENQIELAQLLKLLDSMKIEKTRGQSQIFSSVEREKLQPCELLLNYFIKRSPHTAKLSWTKKNIKLRISRRKRIKTNLDVSCHATEAEVVTKDSLDSLRCRLGELRSKSHPDICQSKKLVINYFK